MKKLINTEKQVQKFINQLINDKDLHDNYIDFLIDENNINNYIDFIIDEYESNPIFNNKIYYRLIFDNMIYSYQFNLLNKLKLNYFLTYNDVSNKLLLNFEILK